MNDLMKLAQEMLDDGDDYVAHYGRKLESLAKGAEPVGTVVWDGVMKRKAFHIDSDLPIGTELYTASIPAPVAVPDALTYEQACKQCPHPYDAAGYSVGWNACRAAMLVSQPSTETADDRRDAEQLGIGKAIERAAKELPEGWSIEISVSKDGGCIHLINPEAEGVDFPTNHERLSEEINDAIDAAKGDGA